MDGTTSIVRVIDTHGLTRWDKDREGVREPVGIIVDATKGVRGPVDTNKRIATHCGIEVHGVLHKNGEGCRGGIGIQTRRVDETGVALALGNVGGSPVQEGEGGGGDDLGRGGVL